MFANLSEYNMQIIDPQVTKEASRGMSTYVKTYDCHSRHIE